MKIKFTFLFILFCAYCFAQNEFITLWKPNNPSSIIPGLTASSTTQIYFPGAGNNYKIYWEEIGNSSHNGTLNNVTSYTGNPVLINFGSSSSTNPNYLIKVSNGSGYFYGIEFYFNANYRGDAEKILAVTQWGNVQWITMRGGFWGCKNMNVTAIDTPNLEKITDLSYMFYDCISLIGNSSFNGWNTSNVVKINAMFGNAKVFNQNIGNWDISKVTDLRSMFSRAAAFNQNIGNWNTSNVKEMNGVFAGASVFNQDIRSWDTSKVIDMSLMFSSASNFNQNIGNWNTSNVEDMNSMFSGAKVFNQNIGIWDTSKVTDMNGMFNNTDNFNQNLDSWNTSNVIDMGFMFYNAKAFNQKIENWNTSKVMNMSGMFYNSKFNQDLANWNTASVTNMKWMFYKNTSFNQNISSWNTSKVKDMSVMFNGATAFNQNIGNWNTSNVEDMSSMFSGAKVFNQNIGNWNTSKVKDMAWMFSDATAFNQNLGNWNTSNVEDMSSMFNGATAFNQNLENWKLQSLTSEIYYGAYDMLKSSGLSCDNYNKTLIGWANDSNIANNVYLGSSNLVYSSAQAVVARNSLIGKGWTISGDTYNPNCALTTNELQNKKLKVYPNPAKDFILIDNLKDNVEFEIYDIQGKLVKKEKYNDSISLENLSRGIYIIKIPSENYSKKIVVE